MVYNDLHAKSDASDVLWTEEIAGEIIRRPVVEIDVQKNKLSEFKDILYYKFSPPYSKFYECDGEEIKSWKKNYGVAMRKFMDKVKPEGGKNPFISSCTVDTY